MRRWDHRVYTTDWSKSLAEVERERERERQDKKATALKLEQAIGVETAIEVDIAAHPELIHADLKSMTLFLRRYELEDEALAAGAQHLFNRVCKWVFERDKAQRERQAVVEAYSDNPLFGAF